MDIDFNDYLTSGEAECDSQVSRQIPRKMRTRYSRQQRKTLDDWVNEHRLNPYPTRSETCALGRSTGLEEKQVANYMSNFCRRRLHGTDSIVNEIASRRPNTAQDIQIRVDSLTTSLEPRPASPASLRSLGSTEAGSIHSLEKPLAFLAAQSFGPYHGTLLQWYIDH